MNLTKESPLTPLHRRALHRAYYQLENQNFAARLAEYAGQPVDRLLRIMPKPASQGLHRAIEIAVLRCLNLAVRSIDQNAKGPPARRLSSLAAGLSGAVGGFFGAAALPIELPVTTALMLRAIADTARHCRRISRGSTRALPASRCSRSGTGGRNGDGKRLDVGYYATRALLAKLAGDASTLADRAQRRGQRRCRW